MIKNKTIKEKIEEKTKDDPIMNNFIYSIINHEMESGQYKKKYTTLIEESLAQKGEK